jgi:tetratricopeptide (TPR) repeat protein
MSKNLPEEIFPTIVSLINKAKIEINRKEYAKALIFYQKAESLFLQPIEECTGACFLFYSIAQVFLIQQKEEEALSYSARAIRCLDEVNDAKVWYQSGLLHLRMGKADTAKVDFKNAYKMGGKSVFVDAQPDEVAFFEKHIY